MIEDNSLVYIGLFCKCRECHTKSSVIRGTQQQAMAGPENNIFLNIDKIVINKNQALITRFSGPHLIYTRLKYVI